MQCFQLFFSNSLTVTGTAGVKQSEKWEHLHIMMYRANITLFLEPDKRLWPKLFSFFLLV